MHFLRPESTESETLLRMLRVADTHIFLFSTGSRQARDTIPLARATDFHRGEAGYASPVAVVAEEDSAEGERRRIRSGVLAVMISFEDKGS